MRKRDNVVEEQKRIFLEAYERAPIVSAACDKAGIHRATFYQWLKNDKEFKKKVEEIDKRKVEILEDALYGYALKGNPTLLIFLACNWAPDKYKNIQKVDVSGTGNVIIHFEKAKNKEENKQE